MNQNPEAPSARAWTYFVVFLLISAGLQSSVSAHCSFLGGEPDFPFTLAMVTALLSDSSVGALTGFGSGLIMASMVGQTVGTYLVSRTLAGWVVGWSTARLYRSNAGVVVLGVLVASLISEVVYLLAAPRVSLGLGIKSSLIGSVWNAALAWPMTMLLRQCGWGTRL